MENEKKINRMIWVVKLGMIAFGYLILSMIQHTINPISFHWVATIIFFLWVMIWLKANVNRVN
tara:strand:- start:53 stop:241 length:189 start_codon:yes stop_codon:yes gene_type:complete